jgi:hypothetical protein
MLHVTCYMLHVTCYMLHVYSALEALALQLYIAQLSAQWQFFFKYICR